MVSVDLTAAGMSETSLWVSSTIPDLLKTASQPILYRTRLSQSTLVRWSCLHEALRFCESTKELGNRRSELSSSNLANAKSCNIDNLILNGFPMSNDVSATDLSVASDLPEVDVQIEAQSSVEVQSDSAPGPVPVEVVVVGSPEKDGDDSGDAPAKANVPVSYTHLTLPTTPYV